MFKKIILSMLLSVLIIGQLTVVSEASATGVNNGIEFFVNYAEPATSEYEGYITLLIKSRTTSEYVVTTAFWYCCAYKNGQQSPCAMYIELTDSSATFRPGGSSIADGAFYSISRYWANGGVGFATNSSSQPYTLPLGDWQIVGYKYSGNVGAVTGVASSQLFSVFFATDGSATLLMDILGELQSMKDIDSTIKNTVSSILGSVDNVEGQLEALSIYLRSAIDSIGGKLGTLLDKADKMINEQEKTNTWLEKIFDYLNESAESQKQEAQTQGGNSISQGTASIEDKGAGFANSMGGLVSSMSYSGTECAWTFPEVRVPAIKGVMDEVVLIEEQPIDFTMWINAIPAPILLLIQSLLTMGLIVYCFKELYGTISYVLTLRGGGSNE